MKEILFIINTPCFTWIPPNAGYVEVSVEQVLIRDHIHYITHFCVDVCERLTFCNGNAIPSLFTFLSDKNNHVMNYTPAECVHMHVDKPMLFYFVDENNEKIKENCPILKVKVTYLEKK